MVFLFLIPISTIFIWWNRKVKYNKLFLILLLAMVIIMGGSIENPDTGVYYDLYYTEDLFTKDILFGFLMVFFKQCGLNVDEFRLVICLMSLCLIYSVVFRYTQSPFIFTILYSSYPFFYDIVQLRNFLGIAVVIFALSIFYDNSKLKKIIGLILFICAILIQKTHLVIPVFILIAYFIKRNRKIRIITIITSLLLGVLCLSQSVMSIVSEILIGLNLAGIEGFTERITNLGWIVPWVIHFANCVILYYIKSNMLTKLENNVGKFTEAIYYINLASTICIFLYILNPTFTRILRNIMIIDFIVIAYYLGRYLPQIKVANRNYEICLESMTIVIYCVAIFVLTHVLDGSLEWIPNIFQYNWILFGGSSHGLWLP